MASATPAVPADYTLIEHRADYVSAVDAIAAGEGPVAVDAERASGYRYSQRAYLIQVFRRGAGTFLFDAPAIGEFTELQSALASEEWVIHAASQDLTCLREVGLDPVNLFDTELAARLAGLPRVGLGTVVEQLLGIHLAKEHSAADWSTRPLPLSWLTYAALDVALLIDVRDELDALLHSQRKHEFARQEFEATLQRELVTVRAEPWRRLSGLHGIRQPRGLAVARALWHARDDYAREIDTAAGRLVPDASLVAAAKALPSSKRALAGLKEFNGRASRSQLDRWWAAIEAGLADKHPPATRAPADGGPPPPRVWADRNPDADVRLKAARAALTARSEELEIPLENLLTPDLLRRVAWEPPHPVTAESIADALARLGARPWQTGATAQVIAEAFVDAVQAAENPGEPVS